MFKRLFAGFAVAALATALISSALSAHEHRDVGDYTLVVGFLNEPTFEGQANAASIRISKHGTDANGQPSEAAVPVTGVADTLQVAVTHIPTGANKVMPLRAVFGQDGLYAADFVPTAPGSYSFRFFGKIEDTDVNETFTSGPNTFDEVGAAQDIQFPVQLAQTRELQNAVQGVQDDVAIASDTADSADSTATTAMTIGIVGLVVGILGVGIGGYATMTSRKK